MIVKLLAGETGRFGKFFKSFQLEERNNEIKTN